MNKIDAKKRLMFITGEDFYFLTYNILLLLKALNCDGKRQFKDHRKLAYLIDFVANENLIDIVETYSKYPNRKMNSFDKELLIQAWSNGLVREKLINRLLQALEKKGLIGINRRNNKTFLDVWYMPNETTKKFFKEGIFEIENNNAKKLTKVIKRLSNSTFEKTIEKLFTQFGINNYGLSTN